MKKRKQRIRKLARKPLLELFLQALGQLYPKDTLAPGVSLAYLPKEQTFYGSVCRYDSPQHKQVLLSVKEPSLLAVISELAAAWHASAAPAVEFAKEMRAQRTAHVINYKATKRAVRRRQSEDVTHSRSRKGGS